MKLHAPHQQEFGSAEFFTPPEVVALVWDLLGGQPELDPASCPAANAHFVGAQRYYTEQNDGLAQDWVADSVYCNPPGGKSRQTQKFWRRLHESYCRGEVNTACFLSFSLDALQTTQKHSAGGVGGVLLFPTFVFDRRVAYWRTDPATRGLVKTKGGFKPSALTFLPRKGAQPLSSTQLCGLTAARGLKGVWVKAC